MKLNLGAGDDRREGYLGIDCRLSKATDIVADIRSLPFKDGCIEIVLALDVIEHLQRYELDGLFQELFRILDKAGRLYIKTPNFNTLVEAYVNQEIPFEEFERKLFGEQDFPENTHKTGFNPDSLARRLQNAGFLDVQVQEIGEKFDWSNMIIKAVKA